MDADLRALERDIRYDYEQLINQLRGEVERLRDRVDHLQYSVNTILNGDDTE